MSSVVFIDYSINNKSAFCLRLRIATILIGPWTY